MESGNYVQKKLGMKNKIKECHLDEKTQKPFLSSTMVKHPKFDSNHANCLSFDNPFAPDLRPSDLFKISAESHKKSLKILNFHGNDFSFPTIKPDSISTWALEDSKAAKKFSENSSKAQIYLSKFNDSEIKSKN